MTQSTSNAKKPTLRGRLFPNYNISSEELAKIQSENEAFYQRCREIFDRIQPQLMKDNYNWFIAIEPNSGDYFIDVNNEIASQKAHQKYPKTAVGIFRLNKTGVCGRI